MIDRQSMAKGALRIAYDDRPESLRGLSFVEWCATSAAPRFLVDAAYPSPEYGD